MSLKLRPLWQSLFSSSLVNFLLNILIIVQIVIYCTQATNLEEELTITYEQKYAIDKLRQRVLPFLSESYMKEDLHLLRWLRATKFDIDEAQRRVLENVKWRKQSNMSTIHLEDFTEFETEYPYFFTVDKQGQPTFVGYAGEWDVRAAVVTGRAGRLIRYINRALEQATQMVRKMQHEGKNVTRLNLIIDLDGFNIPQHGCVQCLFRILDFVLLYDNNYPGMADRVIFTNTPPTVAAAAAIVRNNANSVTMKALKVYSKDKNVWQKALLEFIDRDKLPVRLGGTLEEIRREGDL